MSFNKKIDPSITWIQIRDAQAQGHDQDKLLEDAPDAVIYTLASMTENVLLSSKALAQIAHRKNAFTIKNTFAGAAGGFIASIIFNLIFK